MKPSVINRKINAKVNDWLETIDDEALRKLLKKNIIVTGGCITSMLLDEKVNDYDVYFKTLEATQAAAEYYIEQFSMDDTHRIRFGSDDRLISTEVRVEDGRVSIYVVSAGIAGDTVQEDYEFFELIDDNDERESRVEGYVKAAVEIRRDGEDLTPYRPVFLTSNAITLSDGIQLVTRFYGTPAEIHRNFDFTHCKNYWCSWLKPASRLTLLKDAVICIINRRLHYTNSKYPLASLFRTRKFLKRGWTCSLGEYLKIVFALQSLDLTDVQVLQDQLIGMDAAYFAEIIHAISDADIKTIDTSFIASVVDELY